MNLIDFLKNHFFHALPILLAGVFAIAIILERLKALYQTYPIRNRKEFFDSIAALVMKGQLREAIQVCDKYPKKPVAKLVKTALVRSHLPETVIEDGLQVVTNEATHSILKRTSFLATIANVATLLGLFGTIAGLIHSFEAVGHADPQQKSALLSAGIATAMNATMLGLAVAIPSMIAFSFLISRSNFLIAETQNSAVQILDILKQRFYASETFEQALERVQVSATASPRENGVPHPESTTKQRTGRAS